MKDIRGSVFGMMGFYFIMSACFIRGIPTYTEELLAKLSLVYEVIILPVILINCGMLGILLFLGTFVVDISSIMMLISILSRAGKEYKEYSS